MKYTIENNIDYKTIKQNLENDNRLKLPVPSGYKINYTDEHGKTKLYEGRLIGDSHPLQEKIATIGLEEKSIDGLASKSELVFRKEPVLVLKFNTTEPNKSLCCGSIYDGDNYFQPSYYECFLDGKKIDYDYDIDRISIFPYDNTQFVFCRVKYPGEHELVIKRVGTYFESVNKNSVGGIYNNVNSYNYVNYDLFTEFGSFFAMDSNDSECFDTSLPGYVPKNFTCEIYGNIEFDTDQVFRNSKNIGTLKIHDEISGKFWSELNISAKDSVKLCGIYRGNTKLTKLDFLAPIEEIGPEVFSDCTNLTYVSLPKTVKVISEDAFSGCTNLTKIHYEGSAPGFPWGATNATLI